MPGPHPAQQPEAQAVQHYLQEALAKLVAQDAYLLANDLNERTITHKLAEYLQPLFPDRNVDCEYNRDGHEPKRVRLQPAGEGPPDLGSYVYPDIIVHQRGTNDHNLLIIEAKKAYRNNDAIDHDRAKVEAFASDLRYRFGAVVVFKVTHENPECRAFFYSDHRWTELGA